MIKSVPDIISLDANRVWRTYLGGRMLDIQESKILAEDSHFPEDWIASTTRAVNPGREEYTEEGISILTIDGEAYFLTDVLESYPNEMVGSSHFEKYGAKTQFLLKFLDSSIRLHLQVHPTIAFSKKHLNSPHGKTEAYIILEVRKEVKSPYIYLGFQKPVSKRDFKKAVANQDIETLTGCFDKIPISPGDVFIVPGGMPHAIGPGILMIEIMEPTDFVARLEYERGGFILPWSARYMGKGIDFAMNMLSFEQISVETVRHYCFCKPNSFAKQPGGYETVLIDSQQTACFGVHRLHIARKYRKRSVSFYVGIVTAGKGVAKTTNMELKIKKGDRFFVPYHTDLVDYLAEDPLQIVLAFPPM